MGRDSTKERDSGAPMFRYPVNMEDPPGIRYTKSPSCRVIQCEGASCSVTPSGKLSVGFFTEHMKLPESASLQLNKAGNVTEEMQGQDLEIVREFQVVMVLPPQAAKRLGAWLDRCINFVEEHTE